ncbi:unnamed protein product [Rotaria magnacalcarata]|uniref:SGNH hydrolase-type esterase domain-containing protein n=1 Tax=Rotaria magnacalcarata TaxID=392030 RepID=A0A819ULT7_9BILA|nr:unnamed protein product [Rotaria magnacalcarata]CAF4097757.1 unnamed protein product [Rotaria magnacalcarata]
MMFSSSNMQKILIISDSHGKCLDSPIITPNYQIDNYSFSGLRWINNYNSNLCLFSLIQKEPFSSLLSTSSYVFFLIGTNSVRNYVAPEIINQIGQIFSLIYSQYPHLKNQKLIVTTCIPCFKTTKRFPTTAALMNNIYHYNHLLFILSHKFNFHYFDLHMPIDWLSSDMMHVGRHYHNEFSNLILNYINNLHVNQNISITIRNRSPEAIHRRNKKRNFKLKMIQKNFTLRREISSLWSYTHLKNFLKYNGIRFGTLSIMSNHILYLRFNNIFNLRSADHALPMDIFDSIHFIQWFEHIR